MKDGYPRIFVSKLEIHGSNFLFYYVKNFNDIYAVYDDEPFFNRRCAFESEELIKSSSLKEISREEAALMF